MQNNTMRPVLLSFIILLTATVSCRHIYRENREILNLSGTWKFQLDSANAGIQEK